MPSRPPLLATAAELEAAEAEGAVILDARGAAWQLVSDGPDAEVYYWLTDSDRTAPSAVVIEWYGPVLLLWAGGRP